jgi:DNA replication licensing factor MCM7
LLILSIANQEFKAAFEDFLQSFKTAPKTAASAAEALLGMHIDDDDLSDDYDFMDDDDGSAQEARRARKEKARLPQKKYMDLLQNVANRAEKNITIELDDLAVV